MTCRRYECVLLRAVAGEEYVEWRMDTSALVCKATCDVVCVVVVSGRVCCCIRFERSFRSRGVVENGVLVVGLHGHVV